jgi:hypothetical protein
MDVDEVLKLLEQRRNEHKDRAKVVDKTRGEDRRSDRCIDGNGVRHEDR